MSPKQPFLLRLAQKVFAGKRNFLSLWRRKIFPINVSVSGGQLIMAHSIRFDQKVQFQGEGTLILDGGVILGYWLSGSSHWPILFQPRELQAKIQLGKRTAVSNGCEFIARTAIIIGENCRIGPRCIFMDSDFHDISPDKRNQPGHTVPIYLDDNVWLGADVMVLKGIRIGKDAIVGARCVVVKNVPDGAIAVGNPMKIIGTVYA